MTIVTEVGHHITVPTELRAFVRAQSYSTTLQQHGSDIWTSHAPVASHFDNTEAGLCTYGAILINDPGYVFVHGGHEFAIPPGALYKMDGRILHETRGTCGLLAVLVWDMPPEWSLDDFAAELARDPRFHSYCPFCKKRHPGGDVCMGHYP